MLHKTTDPRARFVIQQLVVTMWLAMILALFTILIEVFQSIVQCELINVWGGVSLCECL